jgi:RhtB (resistance to homoserine/threonine) family protein
MVSILPSPLVRRYKSADCRILQTRLHNASQMFGIHDFALFVTTGILLNLTPGPDTLYILGRSIAHGRRAGVASALGISVGSIFHTGAAALGLSVVLATSAWAFTFVKLAGAAYLIFLGIRALLEKRHELSMPAHFKRRSAAAAFRQGILTNILNPKVALFFLAFLPQFIDAAASSKTIAFAVLGLTFVTTGTIWCLILAWFSSAFSARLRENPTLTALMNRAVGSLFVFLGLRLATAAKR